MSCILLLAAFCPVAVRSTCFRTLLTLDVHSTITLASEQQQQQQQQQKKEQQPQHGQELSNIIEMCVKSLPCLCGQTSFCRTLFLFITVSLVSDRRLFWRYSCGEFHPTAQIIRFQILTCRFFCCLQLHLRFSQQETFTIALLRLIQATDKSIYFAIQNCECFERMTFSRTPTGEGKFIDIV